MRVLLLVGLAVATVFSAPAADLVTNLPGLNTTINFQHYSGYLKASSNANFHYWFTLSQQAPTTDPLILWLNGGPGCSSVGGLIEELGPFHVADNGNTVYINPYAWNTFANVLFIESPAGVGYSYALDGNVATDDDKVATDNYNALIDFLNKFPEYKGREFYITGESYGGIYLPTLGKLIAGDKVNFPKFTGMAIGNGIVNFPLNYDTMPPLFYYHGLVDDDLYNDMSVKCCNNNPVTCDIIGAYNNKTCKPIVNKVLDATNELDPYNLYSTCYLDSPTGSKRSFIHKQIMKRIGAGHIPSKAAASLPLCAQSSNTQTYMNRADVRAALHIPSLLKKWTDCSDAVGNEYQTTHTDVTPEVLAINAAGVKILFYNGDVDTVCNHVMNRNFLTRLNRPIIQNGERVNKKWTYAKEDPNVAGFQLHYQGNISFLTVRGSGHFVPEDKPREALQMIYNFVKNKDYSTATPF